MKQTLSTDKASAEVDGLSYKVGQTIGYQSSDDGKVGVGKITELKHPGYRQSETESVWMCIADVVTGFSEWQSCALNKEQRDAGLFNEMKIKPNVNTSNQPSNIPATPTDLW